LLNVVLVEAELRANEVLVAVVLDELLRVGKLADRRLLELDPALLQLLRDDLIAHLLAVCEARDRGVDPLLHQALIFELLHDQRAALDLPL